MFGPGRGDKRTGPFVVAVLVASPDGCVPPVPMKAYAQPCWSAEDILPLDSGRERETLDILVRFQGWMVEQGYAVEVTKPLYDRAKYYFGDENPDQVVKPDFEGTVQAVSHGSPASIFNDLGHTEDAFGPQIGADCIGIGDFTR